MLHRFKTETQESLEEMYLIVEIISLWGEADTKVSWLQVCLLHSQMLGCGRFSYIQKKMLSRRLISVHLNRLLFKQGEFFWGWSLKLLFGAYIAIMVPQICVWVLSRSANLTFVDYIKQSGNCLVDLLTSANFPLEQQTSVCQKMVALLLILIKMR